MWFVLLKCSSTLGTKVFRCASYRWWLDLSGQMLQSRLTTKIPSKIHITHPVLRIHRWQLDDSPRKWKRKCVNVMILSYVYSQTIKFGYLLFLLIRWQYGMETFSASKRVGNGDHWRFLLYQDTYVFKQISVQHLIWHSPRLTWRYYNEIIMRTHTSR